MSSSLRNAVKRITHKERSQPLHRATKYGLLEKKSDYQLRSRDYHRKASHLKNLRKKVMNRNPDEFYFGMHTARVDGMSGNDTGRHIIRTDKKNKNNKNESGGSGGKEQKNDFEIVRVMKDQDLAYIRMKRMMDAKKIEKLKSSLHFLEYDDIDDPTGDDNHDTEVKKKTTTTTTTTKKKKNQRQRRKHTVFVEGDISEISQFDVAKHFETHPDLISRAFNRPRVTATSSSSSSTFNERMMKDNDKSEEDDEDDDDDDDRRSYQLPSKTKLMKAARQQRKLERSIAKARSGAYTEMEKRIERYNKLKIVEEKLISEQHAYAKGRKRKIETKTNNNIMKDVNYDDHDGGGGTKLAVYKWRRKRAK